MERFKKISALFLAVVMLISVMGVLAGCGGDPVDPTGDTQGTQGGNGPVSGKKTVYEVSVKSVGGMAMEGLSVYIYTNSAKTELVDFGETDAEGKVSFELAESSEYAVELQGVTEGYKVEDYYTFSGKKAKIELVSSLITNKTLSEVSPSEPLTLGDVMYDFSVTTPDGQTVTLSEVLEEKKMVLLNFWYSTCGPCANEFPYMDEAWQKYKDEAHVIAVDPLEDNAKVGSYQATMGMSFTMAACPTVWSQAFNVTGYPTSVVIDRYGVICLIEVGGITSLSPFTSIFEYFTSEDYQQMLCPNGVSDIVVRAKPDQTMDSSENIAAVLNKGDVEVTYRADEDEYAWPFVKTEKNGVDCFMATNQGIEGSYAILYADVTLKAGQAVGFDYLASTENGGDFMHVIVDDEPIFTISGADEVEQWKSCYPCVATEDGVYEVALCYIKDESDNVGDDTVYIKGLRVVDADEIDTTAHLPRQAAVSEDGFEYSYVDIVLNEKDGYYHVGTKDGPLLLAVLMDYTQFSEEETLWDIAYNGKVQIDGVSLYDKMVDYFSYSSNSLLNGVCTVNEELAGYLKLIAETVGFDDSENEWLKMCKYYEAYGKDAQQMEDPIKGLAPFSAPEAVLGKNKPTNFFYYNTAIIPRGKLMKFVPDKSGVYRITSSNGSEHGVDGWIFSADRTPLLTYEMDERLFNDSDNVSMVFYMEAGKDYYIDIAFWDVYEEGYIYFDIEYVGNTLEHFRLASPGYFTYDTDATGEAMYHVVAGGIDVAMGPDGYYHELIGTDANGKPILGSIVYADFTGVTSLFSNPIATVDSLDEDGNLIRDENGNVVKVKGMIDMGGFDFSKTENDLFVIGVLDKHDGDQAATDKYLREYWGEDYEGNAASYKLKDIYAGKYHGTGEDLTEEMRGYLSKMYAGSAKERVGCVPVDARLAEMLQLLMDKYTFEDVDNAWTKLCYYYDHIGPEA
ncbi:MAG: TlpA family protein disulfide reductase [Oscillospiraceae bacterium]|nr:TlpA family protein disulfide reductase [Oscillospiraceae bacterium]